VYVGKQEARGSVGLRTLMLLQNWCWYQHQCITLQQKRSVYMSSFNLPGGRLPPSWGESISLPGGDSCPDRLVPPQLPLLLLGQQRPVGEGPYPEWDTCSEDCTQMCEGRDATS